MTAKLRYLAHRRFYAGSPGDATSTPPVRPWLVDLTPAIRSYTKADAGTNRRDFVAGQSGAEAVPTQHANSFTFADMRGGTAAQQLLARPTGLIFMIDATADRVAGGPYDTGSDEETVPTGDLLGRSFTLRQADGPWVDGPAAATRDRITALDLGSGDTASGISLDPSNDLAWFIITAGAAGSSLRLGNATGQADAVATVNPGIYPIANVGNLGSAPVTNGVVTPSGLTGGAKVEGFLIAAPAQGIR